MLANPDIGVTQIARRLGVSPATLLSIHPCRTHRASSLRLRPKGSSCCWAPLDADFGKRTPCRSTHLATASDAVFDSVVPSAGSPRSGSLVAPHLSTSTRTSEPKRSTEPLARPTIPRRGHGPPWLSRGPPSADLGRIGLKIDQGLNSDPQRNSCGWRKRAGHAVCRPR
jgi:hypothetical protein